MKFVERFFHDLDGAWTHGGDRILFQVIGSTALMFQFDYERLTNDSDVIETAQFTVPIKAKLEKLAGKNSPLFQRYRLYLDIVNPGIPFILPRPSYHPVPSMVGLKNIEVQVLDVLDVAVSKLARFKASDVNDIRAVVERNLISHPAFLARFKAVLNAHSMDARRDDFPKYVKNFNTIERDFFHVKETEIDLDPIF